MNSFLQILFLMMSDMYMGKNCRKCNVERSMIVQIKRMSIYVVIR